MRDMTVVGGECKKRDGVLRRNKTKSESVRALYTKWQWAGFSAAFDCTGPVFGISNEIGIIWNNFIKALD